GLPASPPARDPKELAKIPPYKRLLQGEDAKRVAELEAKVNKLEEAGKFAEAAAPAKEILGICTRVQGADHWQTVNAKWTVDTLEEIASLPPETRTQWAEAEQTHEAAKALPQKARSPPDK